MKTEEKLKTAFLQDLYVLWDNLEDDLEMDETGEQGYRTHKEVVKAIKKYTQKVLQKKIKKYETANRKNRLREEFEAKCV